MKASAYALIGLALGLAAVMGAWLVDTLRPYTFQGSVIEPAKPAAAFELTDQQGNTFRLEDQKGKILLVFFGYTHCPDVCPVTLSEMKKIAKVFEGERDQVDFVFITVDPERDTPALLKEYLGYFDPSFIGLTGSEQKLAEIWLNYGVYRAKTKTESKAEYLVEHTARIYLIDQAGNLKVTYPFGFEANRIIKDIRYLLKQGG